MNQKKAVVTGGAGFIGSHLVSELLKRSYRVIILDDLSTGDIERVREPINDGTADFVQGTITDFSLLRKVSEGAAYIFHLASMSNVPRSLEYPRECHELNVTGTLNVLTAARENGVAKVVYASSAAVYGDSPEVPKRESMSPQPLSPYAATKLAAEHYCRVFETAYGLATVCLRYFNVYGPGQRADSDYAAVIPSFIDSIRRGRPPVIYGDGEQTRDFVYVKDVVKATVLAAESPARGIYNIAGGKSVTMKSLAGLIMKLSDRELEPVYRTSRPGDIRHSLADITGAKGFGFQPKYSLEAGLRETVGGVI